MQDCVKYEPDCIKYTPDCVKCNCRPNYVENNATKTGLKSHNGSFRPQRKRANPPYPARKPGYMSLKPNIKSNIMIYLAEFRLLSEDAEWQFFRKRTKGCYDSFYPYQFFPIQKELQNLNFSDVTIFCGSNGSGKSTLLNIIAEKLELNRETPYNKTDFFDPYTNGCWAKLQYLEDREKRREWQRISRIITSDDVFQRILSVRERNDKLQFKREIIFEEKADIARNGWQGPRGFNADDPDSIKAYLDYYEKFSKPADKYIRKNVGVEERTYSNGENVFKYFTDTIQPGGLYLLDEPENSLSAEMQLELAQFIQGMARFYNCQFIMSTHSPFLLSLPQAVIYNLDEIPVRTCRWTDLPNVKIFYKFFKDHEAEFEE